MLTIDKILWFIVICLCLLYSTVKCFLFLFYNRCTSVNYYFGCMNPPFYSSSNACPKIIMKTTRARFGKNAQKNKRFFLSCLKHLSDYLNENTTYSCTTHLLIKKHLERSNKIEIISCEIAETAVVFHRNLILEKAMLDGSSFIIAFIRYFRSPCMQFYNIRFRLKSTQLKKEILEK